MNHFTGCLFIFILLLSSENLPGASIAEVDSLHEMSYPLLKTNKDSAYVLAEISLEKATQINYPFGIANSNYILAYIHQHQNEPTRALYFYLKAAKILKHFKDYRSIHNHIEILVNTAVILKKYGKYDEAHQFLGEALDVIKKDSKHKYNTKEVQLLYNRALVYEMEGKYDEVSLILENLIPRNKELGFTNRYLNCLNLAGTVRHFQHDYTESMKYYQMILDSNPSLYYKGLALNNIGEIYYELNQFDSAEFYYLNSIEAYEADNPPLIDRIFFSYRDLTKMYLKKRDYSNCVKTGVLSIDYFEYNVPQLDNYIIFKYLSEAYHHLGDAVSSYKYSNRYYEENEKYQRRQEELIQLRDEFKIDVFLEEYYSQQPAGLTLYQKIVILALVVIMAGVVIYQLRLRFNKAWSQNP